MFIRNQIFRSFSRNIRSYTTSNNRNNLVLNSIRSLITKAKTGNELNLNRSATIDLNEFNEIYEQARHKAINDLLKDKADVKALNEAKQWLQTAIDYNVGTGKRNRARICWLAYRHLCASGINGSTLPTSEKNLQIGILGLCLELMQAYFLVFDDIMDESTTRRGKICWHKKENVGMIAINDGVMISSLIHLLLKQNLSNTLSYVPLLELFNQTTLYTSYGQCLDILSSNPSDNRIDFSRFTNERYDAIVRFKTSYYTFVLPIRSAIYLAEIHDAQTHDEAEEILLQIGHFFQAQDDYLDCYGDAATTGKIGTDIQDGKCSWLFVQALNIANQPQRELLCEHYGSKSEESVEIVRDVYEQLGIEQLFKQYEHDTYKDICKKIEQISDKNLSKNLFHMVLTMIYKRKQ